uniref:Uncharacterized protein n=1 Tax=Anguilla anguilla TaxID=7936 RepID=A0A0E9VTZ5_ANGAN
MFLKTFVLLISKSFNIEHFCCFFPFYAFLCKLPACLCF